MCTFDKLYGRRIVNCVEPSLLNIIGVLSSSSTPTSVRIIQPCYDVDF